MCLTKLQTEPLWYQTHSIQHTPPQNKCNACYMYIQHCCSLGESHVRTSPDYRILSVMIFSLSLRFLDPFPGNGLSCLLPPGTPTPCTFASGARCRSTWSNLAVRFRTFRTLIHPSAYQRAILHRDFLPCYDFHIHSDSLHGMLKC